MRIEIGNYIHRWTTSSFENWWLEFNHKECWIEVVNNNKEDALDKFVEKWCDRWQTVLNHTINLYLDNKERKIKIKIDRWDTWSMDHTLSMIILPMLKQLRASKQGSPFSDDEDVPEHLRSYNAPELDEYGCEGDEYTDTNIHRRWKWILDELIWTFEQHTQDEFITDNKKREIHDERMNNGMRLFAKYYHGLSD